MVRELRSLRDALHTHGILLLHDVALVCATSIIAGRHIRGSWWGDRAGALIYGVLTAIEDEVATVKLLGGKVTLVHKRLFPALGAIGLAASADLPRDAAHLLYRVKKEGCLNTDGLELPSGSRKPGLLANELELQLLVYSRQEHTESGRHARQLVTWKNFLRENGIDDVPNESGARRLFEEAAASVGALDRLPWRLTVPKRRPQAPRKVRAEARPRKID